MREDLTNEQDADNQPFIPQQHPPRAVYIHVPFCANRCFYCDFNTYITRDPQLVWDYLDALEIEMEAAVEHTPPGEVDTIFVGGGTPTYLTSEQMERFIGLVDRCFPHRSASFEFSMEANPGTVEPDKLKVMKDGGVNRISLGAQSFNDQLLKRLGRNHNATQTLRSLENIKNAGFDNLSIDLMFGLPEQTVELFAETLEKAFSLDLPHLSSYSLKVEENSRFFVLYQKDQLILPTEDEELAMYQMLMELAAKHGYQQYEISNFSVPGAESRHNMTYWRNEPYYGIGPGAHGYMAGIRHANIGPLISYLKLVKEKKLPRMSEHSVTIREAMEDFMIMGLRMMDGVKFEQFESMFGRDMREPFGREIERLAEQGLIIHDSVGIRLSPHGIPLGNEVFASFLS